MATTMPAVSRSQMLPAPMNEMIKGLMPDIRNLLPPDIEYEQFRAALWLELTGNRQLKECTIESIRAGAIKAATYGLLPGKYSHLLPFKNKGRLEATFVPNYFGVLLTLERSGKVAKAFAHPVYEGDEFTLDYFADDFHHIPYTVRQREPGAIRFYYGAVKMKDGVTHVEVMSLEQIEAVRKRAPAHDSGPWVTDRIPMSRKTALKACAKYVHLTPQQEEMLKEDDARELTDIPPERHAQNIVDLFGDGNGGFSQHPPVSSLWRETVEAHWQSMPEPLKEQCRAALEDLTTTESAGLALASAVLDTLDNHEESV
jgi:recombination protein RecT